MCGHCAERAALADRVLSLKTRVTHAPDPLLLPIHLQEAPDWRQPHWLTAAGHDPVAALIAMCRAWTDHLTDAPGASRHDAFPPGLDAHRDAWRAAQAMPDAWAWLADDAPTLPDPLPLQAACEELDAYLAGWLGVREPSSPAWPDAMLHERLPRVSAALDLVIRAAPDDERITALALSSPGAASPFSAVDLWLQRRAVQALAGHHGIGVIIGLLGHLRSGAVLALVLRNDLDEDRLRALQAAVHAQPDNGTEGASDLRTALAALLAQA